MAVDLPCVPALPAGCLNGVGQAVGGAASGVIGDVVGNSFAEAMRQGATWVMKTTIGWWIDVPAIDLTSSPAGTIRGYVLWLAIAVATAGVIWQGIVMAVSRRPDPVLTVARGLFTVAFWAAVGVIGPAAALRAGDSFSSWVLDTAGHGQATDRLLTLAGLGSVSSSGAVILLGLLMMIAGLAQAVLMMFREGALVVLSGVVVLAAAGTFTHATRPWLSRVLGWMLALICYKPAAALVYASALTLVGNSDDPRTVLVGLTMMLLSIVALPVLMKFFTWTTGAASGGGGGLAALAGASAAGIQASVALGSAPGRAASQQAAQLSRDLTSGGPGSGGSGGGGSGRGGGGAGPSSGGANLAGGGLRGRTSSAGATSSPGAGLSNGALGPWPSAASGSPASTASGTDGTGSPTGPVSGVGTTCSATGAASGIGGSSSGGAPGSGAHAATASTGASGGSAAGLAPGAASATGAASAAGPIGIGVATAAQAARAVAGAADRAMSSPGAPSTPTSPGTPTPLSTPNGADERADA